jgi:putative oxygen-independent coproporphyrinogen III oxidase
LTVLDDWQGWFYPPWRDASTWQPHEAAIKSQPYQSGGPCRAIGFAKAESAVTFPRMTAVRHLYIHIPFCPKICPYCSFYKEASDRNKTQAFLDAVLVELDRRLRDIACRPETVFFGGGTPSALTVKQLLYLLTGLRERLDLSGLKEWTLEMNPATVSLEKARMLRGLGINRVSMGVQSWDPAMLERLGRVHSAEQAQRSFELLREAGFTNLNLDFIFGVPGQSADTWEQTLEKTIQLNPEHISAYCLTYEEDTEYFRKFQRGEFSQNVQLDATFYETTMKMLEAAGYRQYEISNYAKPGHECLHNLAYWLGNDYLGLGPSAFSTVGQLRWQNVPDTSRYIALIESGAEPVSFEEEITPELRESERIAFGLRTSTGVRQSTLAQKQQEIAALRLEGYLEEVEDRVRLTSKGRMVADSIAELFV